LIECSHLIQFHSSFVYSLFINLLADVTALWPDTEIAQETSSHQDSTRDIITPSPEKKENITNYALQ